MKFQNIQDYQLLRTCLKFKELKLTPELITLRNELGRSFNPQELSTINSITEELYEANLIGKKLSTESQRTFKSLMSSVPSKNLQADVIEYMDTYVTLLDVKRLLKMNTDPERLAWLESYMMYADEETRASKQDTQEIKTAAKKDSEDGSRVEETALDEKLHIDSNAPTTRMARFATAMLTRSPHSIAHSYTKAIEAQKLMYRLNKQDNPTIMESLGTLQKHLLTVYPTNIKAPQIHQESVLGNFMDDIRTGKGVRLAVSNASRTTRGRNVLTSLVIAGVVTPLLVMSLHAGALAGPANSSKYQNLVNTPAIVQMFDQNQLAQIKGYEDMFARFEQEGVLPSNAELHGLLNSIDEFYSDSIKGTLLESYNEYAEQNNLPQARAIHFAYDDTDKNDGPRNVLTITDEKGKSYTVDTDTTNLFESNNISAIYSAERRIDGYRDDLNALPNAQTKKVILSRLQNDFYKVLDALTLDYTFQRNGIVQRIFGDDLTLVSQSQVENLNNSSQTTRNSATRDQDDQR